MIFFSLSKLVKRVALSHKRSSFLRSGGLGGNWWNILLQPLGSIVLVSTLASWQRLEYVYNVHS